MSVGPPVADPFYNKDEKWLLNKYLYGLRRSPNHWYNRFTAILYKLKLNPYPHDPCVFTGVVNDGGSLTATTPSEDEITYHIWTPKFTPSSYTTKSPVRGGTDNL